MLGKPWRSVAECSALLEMALTLLPAPAPGPSATAPAMADEELPPTEIIPAQVRVYVNDYGVPFVKAAELAAVFTSMAGRTYERSDGQPATPAPASTGEPKENSGPNSSQRTGGDEAEARDGYAEADALWEELRKCRHNSGGHTNGCSGPDHIRAALAAAEERALERAAALVAAYAPGSFTCADLASRIRALSARGQGGDPDAKAAPASPEVLDER